MSDSVMNLPKAPFIAQQNPIFRAYGFDKLEPESGWKNIYLTNGKIMEYTQLFILADM